MASIDERIVRLRLDGKQFQSEAAGVSRSLGTLKEKLNFKNADSGLKNVTNSIKSMDISPISKGIEAINQKFSAMGVAAMTVVARITNGAIDAGHKLVSTMTASIRDGFKEYETQMNSVQTIMANTASKGTSLQQVNQALNELNTYADKTIYNFTEMTKNIGTFTAAGVDLRTSVNSIQGIANLAAVSGSTSQQASTAMYQLSQALADGTVKLMDWNSVVNAGMGGEVFQQALIRTSEHLNTGAKKYIEAEGSFRESLKEGWLTSEVLTETLNQFSLAVDTTEQYNNAIKDLVAQGYTQEEAKSIADMAKTAGDAATKVKTFSQLIDTLKEALGSGWTQTWQTVIGDFEEAKDLWTSVSDVMSDAINNMSDSRNNLLREGLGSGWSQLIDKGISDVNGFEKIVTETAKNHGVAVDDIIKKNGSFQKSLKDGWVNADILKESVSKMADNMSKMSAEQRKAQGITAQNVEDMKKLDEAFKNGSLSAEEFAGKLSRISGREHVIQGLGNIFKSLVSIFKAVGSAYREIFPPATGDQLYVLTERFHKFTESLKPTAEQLENIKRIAKGVFSVLDIGKQAVNALFNVIGKTFGGGTGASIVDTLLRWGAALGDFLTHLDKSIKEIGVFETVSNGLGTAFNTILNWVTQAAQGFESFGAKIKNVATTISDKAVSAFHKLSEAMGKAINWIRDNISAGDIFAGLAGGGIFAAAMKLKGLISKIKEVIDGFFSGTAEKAKTFTQSFTGVLDGIHDSLEAFQQGIKAFTLVEIAVAVMLLASAIRKLGEMSPEEIGKGLGAITGLIIDLGLAMKSLAKTVDTYDTKGIVKTAFVMIAMAKSMDMLADAMHNVASLNWEELSKGLIGIGIAMFEMTKAMKGIGKGNELNLRDAVMLVAMAKSIQMIAEPLQALSKMSWEEIGRGLAAMGGALLEMSGIMVLLGKFGKSKLTTAASFVIMAKSLGDIADAFGSFAKNNWDEVGRGLSAMGGALVEMGAVLALVGRFGKSKLTTAASFVIMAKSLGDIATAFNQFSGYDWGSIGRGLTAMGGALAEVGIVLAAVSKIGGVKNVFGAASMAIMTDTLPTLAESFGKFAFYDWTSIGRGLAAMGGALLEVGAVTVAVGKIGGLSSVISGISIGLVVDSLEDLSLAFQAFSEPNWPEIGRGLVAMGGALAEVGVVTVAVGKIGGLSSVLSGISLKMVTSSLEELAVAFTIFANRSWGEIGRGLVAMGGALGEVGLITVGIGKLGPLSGILGGISISLVTNTLVDLAEGFGRFTAFSWDEIGRGLTAMGGALLEVGGISAGVGALSNLGGLLGAATIWTAIQGLDDLANALKKFAEMSWDEIGRGLASMGGALGEVALGSFLNTLSFLGAASISTVAEPLGVLADSVKKWADVKLPEGLGAALSEVAGGVIKWTFSGIGAEALSTAAVPVGQLAESVKKWEGVKVPEGLGDQLKTLADGVSHFWKSIVGSWGLGNAAEPLGTMAESVKKWKDVTVPEGLGDKLASLADGIRHFNDTFMGGWSMSTVTGPLGDMAASVTKWKDVKLPEGLKQNLTDLADGVRGWAFLFTSGWSMSAVIGPLGDMAESIKKWNGVKVPEGMGGGLKDLADGVGAFWNKWTSGSNLESIAKPIGDLATSIKKWADVTIPEDLGGKLKSIAEAVGNFTTISDDSGTLNSSAQVLYTINDAVIKLSQTPLADTANNLKTFVDGLNNVPALTGGLPEALKGFSDQVTSSTAALASAISSESATVSGKLSEMSSGISQSLNGAKTTVSSELNGIAQTVSANAANISGKLTDISNGVNTFATNLGSAFNAVETATGNGMNKMVAKIKSFVDPVKSAGASVSQAAVDGLKSKASGFEHAFDGGMASAAAQIRSYKSSFSSAGGYVASGLAEGIRSQVSSAAQAAAKLAQAAAQAAKDNLKINSPSKVFIGYGKYVGEGLSLGMDRMRNSVRESAINMTDSAINAARNSVSRITEAMRSTMSIHSVVDTTPLNLQNSKLTDIVARGNASIRSMNSGITGIGQVVSTNSKLAEYQDSMITANKAVVQAIDTMRDDLGSYTTAIEGRETAMYVDGKKLATTIAKPMNQQLGTLSRRQRLG